MRSLKIYRLTGAAAVIVAVLSARPLWATDCNQNGIVDKDEVRDGLSADCNENELPDECELAPWDYALRVFSQEDSPELVGAGDFNSDGYLDLVTGNEQATISVFLSRDDGNLQDPVNFPASGRMRNGFRPVDFDGDGDLDVIAPISNSVSIIANDGSGAFLEPRLLPVGGSLRAVAAGDVTENGSPDLVTVDSQGRVSLLEGLGDGTFLDPAPLEIEASTAALLLVDTDSDGHLDIVAGRKSETGISILKGAGDGAFSAALTYDAGDRNASVAVAGDFDSDGNLDLATASPFGIMVFFNDGQDGFTGVRFSSFATRSIQALDLEGDADVDLLVVGLNTRGPYSLSNLGNGKLRKQTLAELDSPLRTAVSGDFDGDGDMDIAATTTELTALSLVFNGEQESQEAELLEFATVPMGSEPHSAAIADVDGDFYPDILTSNGGCDSVSVLRSIPGSSFEPAANYPLVGAQHMNSITTADLDRDQNMDIVAADLGGRVRVLLNLENNLFTPPAAYDTPRPFMVTTADLDGDGFPEILSVDESSLLTVLFNNGAGLFDGRSLELRVGSRPLAVAAGDLDGDGDADLVTANEVSLDLSLFLGNGDGSFGEVVTLPVLGPPRYVVMADLDHDGDLDLATTHDVIDSVGFFRNRGNATFEDQESLALGRKPYSVIAADTNSDGLLDLVTTNEDSSSISILLGNGQGGFGAPFHRATGEGPRFTVAGDADGDGDTDLICAARLGQLLTVFYNHNPVLRADYESGICTVRDFHLLSQLVSEGGAGERVAMYLLPLADKPDSLGSLFPYTGSFDSHREFLMTAFPDPLADLTEEGFQQLVARRASREYFAGEVRRLRIGDRVVYGFSVITDPGARAELLELSEVEELYNGLRDSFHLETLGYFPVTPEEKEVAESWDGPGFPIFSLESEIVRFRRGDVDSSGELAVTDALVLLNYLFLRAPAPTCLKSGDTNDRGNINLTDVLGIVNYLFRSGTPPAEPFQECGPDTTEDRLSCSSYAACG